MKILKYLLIYIATSLSISNLHARPRYVLVLDLSDSTKVRQNWKTLQGSLGGTPVPVPHITLFGGLPLNKLQGIKDAVSIAREAFKKRHKKVFSSKKRTQIHMDFDNTQVRNFGSFAGVKVSDIHIKEDSMKLNFRELIDEIEDQLKAKRINYNRKSIRGYHVSAVKNATQRPHQVHFPAHVYIQCLALYQYDDPGAGQFTKVADFFFKRNDRQHVEQDVRPSLHYTPTKHVSITKKSVDENIITTLRSVRENLGSLRRRYPDFKKTPQYTLFKKSLEPYTHCYAYVHRPDYSKMPSMRSIIFHRTSIYYPLKKNIDQIEKLTKHLPHDSKKRRSDLDQIKFMLELFPEDLEGHCDTQGCLSIEIVAPDFKASTSSSRRKGSVKKAIKKTVKKFLETMRTIG